MVNDSQYTKKFISNNNQERLELNLKHIKSQSISWGRAHFLA